MNNHLLHTPDETEYQSFKPSTGSHQTYDICSFMLHSSDQNIKKDSLQGKHEWSGTGGARIPSSMVGLSFVEPTSIQNLSNATSTVSAAFEKRRPEELNHPSCVRQLQEFNTLNIFQNLEITRSMIFPFLANFGRTGVLQDWGSIKVVSLALGTELEEIGKLSTRLACARDEL